MHFDVNLVVVAGAGDVDVASGIVDGESVAVGEGLRERLIALVLVAEELVHVVGIDVEVAAETAVVDAAEEDSRDPEEEHQGEDASAKRASADGLAGVEVLIPSPLEQHDDAGGDEEHGPPAAIPAPEVAEGHLSGLDEQEDDADCDEHQRADDGAAARSAELGAIGVTLSAEHIALHAGLLFEDAALIAPVALGRRRVLRAGRGWIGRWLVCHGRSLAPFLVVLARFVVLSCGDDGGRIDRWRRWRRCGGPG